MMGRTWWGSVVVAIVVAGCTADGRRLEERVDAHDVADAAVQGAIHCASDLDQVAAYSPESVWSALHVETVPNRADSVARGNRTVLERLGHEEVARRLQAVLDSRTAVDRVAVHAGPWAEALDGSGIAEHAERLSQGMCRARDAATSLARRAGPVPPDAVSRFHAIQQARD